MMNELDDLLDRVEEPHVAIADDVARGRRALRRRHGWRVATTGLAVAGIAGAVAALPAHHDAGPAGRDATYYGTTSKTRAPSPSPSVSYVGTSIDPRHVTAQEYVRWYNRQWGTVGNGGFSSAELEAATTGYREVLAEYVDPGGHRLSSTTNDQVEGTSDHGSLSLHALGSKMDWNDGGMLQILVGRDWAGIGSYVANWAALGMEDTKYLGLPAKVSTTGDDLAVSVKHSDGTIVTLLASKTFGNNGTSTAELGITQHHLLAAAADDRLRVPTHAQPVILRGAKYLTMKAWNRYASR